MGQLEISTNIDDHSEPNTVTIATNRSGHLRVVLLGHGVLFDGEVTGRDDAGRRP